VKIGGKAFSNALRFRKHLLKSRGKRARHGDGLVWHWIAHGVMINFVSHKL
jgi:hypothetical protein